MSKQSSRVVKQETEKLPFALLAKENREILFGQLDHSKGVTPAAKRVAWKSIEAKLSAMGINLIPAGKDWTYLRDVVWRNLKKAVKEKRHKKNGDEVKYTPLDQTVLEIEGISNAEINGPEAWQSAPTGRSEKTPTPVNVSLDRNDEIGIERAESTHEAVSIGPATATAKSRKRSGPKLSDPVAETSSKFADFKGQKAELEMEFLKLQNENLRLMNMKLKLEIKQEILGRKKRNLDNVT